MSSKNEELMKQIRSNYESARKLAQDIWIVMDNQGDDNDKWFFECGFISGLNYNFDGSLREQEPKYSKEFLEFAENLFKEQQNHEN